LGDAVAFDAREAGDLVFFPGHVGILATRDRLFHANAHWKATVEEPLADVIARLHEAGVAEPVTGVRRV
jgi:cell wall-associated NlpC family hydrolase